MPKFRIYKGHDAYVNYVAIVEATNKGEANELMSWRATSRNIKWVKDGVINEYDGLEPFTDMTEEVPEDTPEPEESELYTLTKPQRNTVLAALRFYQEKGMGDPANRSDVIHDIATNGDTEISLDADAIDKLCEELNQ